MPKWYDIKAAVEGDAPQAPVVFLYDDIGYWGTTAKDFADELKELGPVSALTVRINCGGGEVFAGIAIYNLLKTHPAKVTVKVDGLAGSIASVIAMAGDTIEMPSNAMMMIHNPSCGCWGEEDDLRETADVLAQIKKSLVASYRTKTGLADDRIVALMDATSWLTAAEAKELGLCDVVTDAVEATAFTKVSPDRFVKVPEAIAGRLKPAPENPAPPPAPKPENTSMTTPPPNPSTNPPPAEPPTAATPAAIAAQCHGAGFPELTARLLSGPVTAAEVTARLDEAKAIVKAATDLQVGEPIARRLIGEGVSLAAAQAIMTDMKAGTDVHIDTTKPAGKPQAQVWDYSGIYARLNGKKG